MATSLRQQVPHAFLIAVDIERSEGPKNPAKLADFCIDVGVGCGGMLTGRSGGRVVGRAVALFHRIRGCHVRVATSREICMIKHF